MCGFCGILEPGGDPRARAARVRAMTRAMEHRGPDDEGLYEDADVTLGFRRLAVIDLATGQQPIRLPGDRAVIVMNGEIYNFRELRTTLEGRQRFLTRGDVEVALRLWAELGVRALERLDGMFATAIWDRTHRTLLLARDRFGVKPLFFCREGPVLAFASELSALLAGGFPSDRSLDLVELRHFLAQKYLTPGGTILRDVRSLRPGTALEVSPTGSRELSYLDDAPREGPAPSPREAVGTLRSLLAAAVRRQLVADVPLGVFLSGGLDSSTVATLATEATGGPVKTFSVGFVGPGAFSELPAALVVARALSSDHTELVMDPDVVLRDLDAILSRLDGPLGDATAVPTWYMSRLARQRVTVALSGEGADEVFGGYPRQRYDVQLDRLGPLGRRLLPLGLRAAGRRPSARLLHRLTMPPGLERQLDWSRVFLPGEIEALCAVPLPAEPEVATRHAALAERWRLEAARDRVNARLLADHELFLPSDLLPKVDRMSMAHSLEVRVPFLDNQLVAFVRRLPGRLKVGPFDGKLLLRRAASGQVPEPAVARRKQGFDVPLAAWLRGGLREPLQDYLSPAALRRRGLLHAGVVAELLRQHLSGQRDRADQLWALLALEAWMQLVLDRAPTLAAA